MSLIKNKNAAKAKHVPTKATSNKQLAMKHGLKRMGILASWFRVESFLFCESHRAIHGFKLFESVSGNVCGAK